MFSRPEQIFCELVLFWSSRHLPLEAKAWIRLCSLLESKFKWVQFCESIRTSSTTCAVQQWPLIRLWPFDSTRTWLSSAGAVCRQDAAQKTWKCFCNAFPVTSPSVFWSPNPSGIKRSQADQRSLLHTIWYGRCTRAVSRSQNQLIFTNPIKIKSTSLSVRAAEVQLDQNKTSSQNIRTGLENIRVGQMFA
jgi:hypothetical protein